MHLQGSNSSCGCWSEIEFRPRGNLLKKSIITDATCELCHNDVETVDHLIFNCSRAASLWQRVGIVRNNDTTVRHLDAIQRPADMPAQHFTVFIFLCCWNIWKHRNRVVFDAIEPAMNLLLCNCREEARLWAWRLPRNDAHIIDVWCDRLSPM